MNTYFSDLYEEVYIAINDEDGASKKILNFLSNTFGKEFEEVTSDWADEYTFETSTLIIKVNLFNEDLLELVDEGVDIHIVRWYNSVKELLWKNL